jgi:hypothetical protein
MPEKKVFILMCEGVKGEAQACRFCGREFSDQEVLPVTCCSIILENRVYDYHK